MKIVPGFLFDVYDVVRQNRSSCIRFWRATCFYLYVGDLLISSHTNNMSYFVKFLKGRIEFVFSLSLEDHPHESNTLVEHIITNGLGLPENHSCLLVRINTCIHCVLSARIGWNDTRLTQLYIVCVILCTRYICTSLNTLSLVYGFKWSLLINYVGNNSTTSFRSKPCVYVSVYTIPLKNKR